MTARSEQTLRPQPLSGSFELQGISMRCPTCKKLVDSTSADEFRPFCSERCRMVDLGKWAGESYRVAGGKTEDREHPDDLGKKKILH